jgi:Reverse transcriptase (RNA-dependent DNA polymerase)
MVPKQARFYGQAFSASRGVRQGDIVSPIIFNIICDAVIWECERQFGTTNPDWWQLLDVLFYADDGVIAGENPQEVQTLLDFFTSTFARVGLKMNAEKTEALIMNGGKVCPAMLVWAYNRKISGIGSSFTELAKEKVQCMLCGSEVQWRCLATHQGSKMHRWNEWYTLHLTDEEEPEVPLPTFFMPPAEYCISISKDAVETQCPVPDCPY